MDRIALEDIHAGYNKKEILRGVALSSDKTEIIAIIGPNGAGKSTLLKVIAGFLRPSNGTVRFNGREISTLAPHARANIGLAYSMQGGKVFPSLTVKENLEMGAMTFSSKEKKERITTLIEMFSSMKTLLDRRAGLLSGGERHVLALAMVLAKRPSVLLLDEPSEGLSPKLMQEMFKNIRELNRAWETTTLLVEQNVHEAMKIAHRALALVNGQIVLETTVPQTWLQRGVLDKYFLGIT